MAEATKADESKPLTTAWEQLTSTAKLLTARQSATEQAELEAERYAQQMAEWKTLKQQPSSTEMLSSLRRPQLPSHTIAAADRLLSLPSSLLHKLLSFLPDTDFFLGFAQLSHSRRLAFSQPDLHRQHGQERFQLTDVQWQLFRARSWPVLQLAVWKSCVLLEEAKDSRRWQEAEAAWRDELQRPGSLNYRAAAGTAEEQQQAKVGTGTVQAADSLSDSATSTDKDWALECTHLWLLIRYATLYITRTVPNVGPMGERIVYRLPFDMRAMLLDQLTSRHVCAIVSGCGNADGSEYTVDFLPVDWQPLRSLQPSASPVDLSSSTSALSSSSPSSASSSFSRSAASVSSFQQQSFSALFAPRPLGAGDDNLLVLCGSIVPHYGHMKQYNDGQRSHHLFVGPALTEAVERHSKQVAALTASTGAAAAASTGSRVVVVELENAAVIETQDCRWSCSYHERLLAETAQGWVECGALETHGLSLEAALRLRDWLCLPLRDVTEEDRTGLSELMAAIKQQQAKRAADSDNEYQSDDDEGEDGQPVPRRIYCLHGDFLPPHLPPTSHTSTWCENQARRQRARRWMRPSSNTDEGRRLLEQWKAEKERRSERRQEARREQWRS